MGHSLKLIIFPGNDKIIFCHHNVDNNKNKSVQSKQNEMRKVMVTDHIKLISTRGGCRSVP